MKITGTWLHAEGTQRVLGLLEAAGHQAFLVGGCVRNDLLGEPVSDIDIATDARPEIVTNLGKNAGLRAVPTGIDHGTVTLLHDNIPHEVTTYRKDVETDGRHATVHFSDCIKDDARRRDFTMNALYADRLGNIIDPLGGLKDLHNRQVRFIDDAKARIREDYLRILRFFRFYAWYGDPASGPDSDGLAACAMLADGIEQLSKERIGAEMRKLLLAPNPAPAVASMRSAGVLAKVLPGADDQYLAPLVHLENGITPCFTRRLATLGGGDLQDQLRLSNSEAKQTLLLQEQAFGTADIAELGYRFGVDTGRDIALLRTAQSQGMQPLGDLAELERGANAAFPVTSHDLMPQFQGPDLGKKLRQLEARWIASGFTLGRADLLS